MSQALLERFAVQKPVIGMVHLGALPGTPAARLEPAELRARAVAEARLYAAAGVDGLIIENMSDLPYLKGAVGPEVTALMAVVAHQIRACFEGPVGVQVLAGANSAALAIAHAAGLDFIRAEGFVFAHVGDEGLHEACAGALLRERKRLGAERVLVLCDIKKKHSAHALTADVDLAETARAAELFRADGLIVTGAATGAATSLADLAAARAACGLPVLVGSGVGPEQLEALWSCCDGVIVGSHFKVGGRWDGALDCARVEAFMARARATRADHG